MFVNKRIIHDIDESNVILNGEYYEFSIKKVSLNFTYNGRTIGETDGIRIVDTIGNHTSVLPNVKSILYAKDLGIISTDIKHPLSVAVVINVNYSSTYHISFKNLLASQIDFNTDQFKILDILDIQGGNATLTDQEIIFNPNLNHLGLMRFKYIFENEYGYSNNEPVPVLLSTPDLPKDQKFFQQWYLEDCNILPIWSKYTGEGINVAINDPGFLVSHPDIDKNVISRSKIHYYDTDDITLSQHALNVAGIIGASKDQNYCVGVAYDVKISSFQMNFMRGYITKPNFFKDYDVINNAWVWLNTFVLTRSEYNMYIDGYENAIKYGRNGLGSNILFASGNKGIDGLNSNLRHIPSSHVIIVGGINKPHESLFMEMSAAQFISSPGANILVSAPASNIPILKVNNFVLSDYIQSQSTSEPNSMGTSYSVSIVSGIIALMLQSNPQLGYRDVQEILAASAVREENGIVDKWEGWHVNNAITWNGGGYHFSYQYGFGKVDAYAAVKLSESWPLQQTRYNMKIVEGIKYNIDLQEIKDSYIYKAYVSNTMEIEYVTQYIYIIGNNIWQNTNIYLISPSGTKSNLLYKSFRNPISQNEDFDIPAEFVANSYNFQYIFGSTNFKGEQSIGEWQIKIEIMKSEDLLSSSSIAIHALEMQIYGKKSSSKQMIYTDEFSQIVKEFTANNDNTSHNNDKKYVSVINLEDLASYLNNADSKKTDTHNLQLINRGVDIINCAALSSSINLNLGKGKATIDGINVDIKNAKVTHIIGTDFNDRLESGLKEGVKFILNSGNDTVQFVSCNNVAYINKYEGVKTFVDFNADLNSVRQILLSISTEEYFNKSNLPLTFKQISILSTVKKDMCYAIDDSKNAIRFDDSHFVLEDVSLFSQKVDADCSTNDINLHKWICIESLILGQCMNPEYIILDV